MIDFHPVSLADAEWIRKRLFKKNSVSCEYCFGNIFSYSKKIKIEVADYSECLIVKCTAGSFVSYSFPVGCSDENIKASLMAICKDSEENDKKAIICAMTKSDADLFQSIFGDKYSVNANRDAFDYVYNTQDLINLTGKKYQPKRNHISYFRKNMNWKYEKINQSNIGECLSMSKKWLESHEDRFKDELEDELKIIKCVFENYDELGYIGGLIRVDGEVVAYTMGEEISADTFCVHFEKAYSEIRGAYPIINQQFVENELSQYRYINREDDVGKENLRKAKLSYHPEFLFEKYEAQLN